MCGVVTKVTEPTLCCDRQCRILTVLPLITLPDPIIWLIHEI